MMRTGWLSISLGLALMALVLSSAGGGGSAVSPAGAQDTAAETTYYHDTAANPVRIRIKSGDGHYPNNTHNLVVKVVITPNLGSHRGCDASYNDDSTTQGTAVLRLPTGGGFFAVTQFKQDGSRRLVKRPAGSLPDEECRYRVTFPEDEEGASNIYLLDRSWSEEDTLIEPGVGEGPGTAQARYVGNPTPTNAFTGTLFLESSRDVAAGTLFFVDIRQVSSGTGSTAVGCSTARVRVRTPQTPGDTVEHPVSLVDHRHGEAESCVYEVTWPRNEFETDDYVKDPGFTFTTRLSKALADAGQSARGRYIANPDPTPQSETRFEPVVVWNVPVTDYDNDGMHDYGATSPRTSVTVRFSPAPESSELTCSVAGTAITYAVLPSTQAAAGETGPQTNFEVISATTDLIDSPNGTRQRCRYDAVFDMGDMGQSSVRLTKVADASDDTALWGGEPEIVASYANSVQTKRVTFQVLAEPAANGQRFIVQVSLSSGLGAGCARSASFEVTVGSDGTGETSRDIAEWPAGHSRVEDRCVYTVSWADHEAAATRLYPRFGDATVTLDHTVFDLATPTLSMIYGVATYYPDVDLSLLITEAVASHPLWTPRVRFTVTLTPVAGADRNCTQLMEFTIVPPMEASESGQQSIPEGELVLDPPGTAQQCSYDVNWPRKEDGPTHLFVRDDGYAERGTTLSPTDIRGSASNNRIAKMHRYRLATFPAEFEPDVTILVPDIDLDGDGHNDFSGAQFEVTINRTSVSFGDDNCADDVNAIYEVGDDGNVTPTATFTLPGRRSNNIEPCHYNIFFPTLNSGARANQLHLEKWETFSLNDTVVSALEDPAIVRYDTATTQFTAVFTVNGADVGVPDNTAFTVNVSHASGAESGCSTSDASPGPVTVTIDTSDGAADAGSITLVDWPMSWRSADQRCSYVVMWPPDEDDGTSYPQDPQRSPRAPSGIDENDEWHHEAWYAPRDSASPPAQQPPAQQPPAQQPPAQQIPPPTTQVVTAETTFDATLKLVAAAGVVQGTSFDVSISPVSGSHPACSGSPTTVTIAAPGRASDGVSDNTRMRSIMSLVDMPAGEDAHCVYTVGWPMHERVSGANQVALYELDDTFPDYTTEVWGDPNRPATASARYQLVPTSGGSNQGGGSSGGNGGPNDDAPNSNADTPDDDNPGGSGGNGGPNDGTPTPSGGDTSQPDGNTVNPGDTTPPRSVNPGSSSRPSGRGGGRPSGGGGRTSGGSRGGGSGGGSSGPWVVAASSRVPVAVSLVLPVTRFPVSAAIEVMLNVPDTCGDDLTTFGGMPARIGLVYAVTAQPGTTVSVLAANALELAGHAERDGQTRGCELRITLISAPNGCTLSESQTDDAGRTYVELAGGDDISTYAATPKLTCP